MTENDDNSLNDLLSEILDEIKLKIENEHINKKFLNLIHQTSSSCSSSSSALSDDEISANAEPKTKKLKQKPNMRMRQQLVAKYSSDDEDEEDLDGDGNRKSNKQVKYLKTKGEETIDDLPPIDKLNLVLESTVNLVKIGRVISIVDNKLVVIQTLNHDTGEAKPLDEDTILFDENRKGLGKIYETFGPVVSPFYSLRFNLNEIKESQLKVDVGSFIYYAPESSKYTKFIFNVDELRQVKGSDASWNNDNEPPVECIEYSDDEQERRAKRELKMRRAGKTKINNSESDSEDKEDDDDDDEEEDGEEKCKNNKKSATTFINMQSTNGNMKKSKSFSTRGGGRGGQQRINNNFKVDRPANNFNFIPKSNSYQSFSNNSTNYIQPPTNQAQGFSRNPHFMNNPPPPMPPQFPFYPQHPIINNGYFMPQPPYPYYHQHQYPNQNIYPPAYGNGMFPTQPQTSHVANPSLAQNNQFFSQGPTMYKNSPNNSFNRVNGSNHNQNNDYTNKNVKNVSNRGNEPNKTTNATETIAANKNIIKKSF